MVKLPAKISKIPLKKMELWEEANVRKSLAPLLLNELAENIRQNGLVVPLMAKRGKKKNQYLVFSGQRRLEACRIIKKQLVDCYVFEKISEDDARLLSFSENLYREKMSIDDIAKAAFALFKKHGKNYSKTARILGVSVDTLRRYLDYYAIPNAVKKLGEELQLRKNVVTKIYFKFLSISKSLAVIRELGKIDSRNERIKFNAAIRESTPTDSVEKIKKRAKELINSQKFSIYLTNDVVHALESRAKKKGQIVEETIEDLIDDAMSGYS